MEDQKTIAILTKIVELNKVKARIAYDIQELLNKLAGVSAEIGELSGQLRSEEPRLN